MRKHEFFFGLVRIPLEIMIVVGAFLIARQIRVSTDFIPGISLPYRTLEIEYLLVVALVSYLIIATIFSFQRLYAIARPMGIIEEVFTIVKSIFVSFFVMIGLLYMTNGFPYETILIPRLILIYAFVFAMVGIILERIAVRWLRKYGFRHNWFEKNRVLLVTNKKNQGAEDSFLSQEYITVTGYLAPEDQSNFFPYLGDITHYKNAIEKHEVDEVIILSPEIPYETRKEIFQHCRTHGIIYKYIGNIAETSRNHARVDFIDRIPLVEISTIGLTPWGRIVKRVFDLSLGIFLFILLTPVWVGMSLLIVLESRGFPFYVSTRIGRGGKTFSMIKFRSMVQRADEIKHTVPNERSDGPLFKQKNDPRVTKIGRWIRRWSIDELPQIINVIQGNMSFIGPRPHLPHEVGQYSEEQKQVLTIKPGITGMAQVYGRDKNSFEREIELDLFYIENWSLLLDTKILLLTFRAVFQGK